MTFLNEAQAHAGGLIRIKTELYWYEGPRYGADGYPGRICLLLEAKGEPFDLPTISALSERNPGKPGPADEGPELPSPESAAVLLFIDGMSKWILVWVDTVEFIK